VNSGLRVAFVADYSCEGSGGFAPRFPNTCGVSGCQCGLTDALVCFNADRHQRHNSEPRAHDPQSPGFCKDSKAWWWKLAVDLIWKWCGQNAAGRFWRKKTASWVDVPQSNSHLPHSACR